jgi:hypothetical protein
MDAKRILNFLSDVSKNNNRDWFHVKWNGGEGERIPAWATRVVQDEHTKIFCAQVWSPEQSYQWSEKSFSPSTSPLLIYECHIGMILNWLMQRFSHQ